MGNYCKSVSSAKSNDSSSRQRISFKTLNDDWRKISQLLYNARTTTVKNGIAPEFVTEKRPYSLSVQEFISMCSENRPPGVSNED